MIFRQDLSVVAIIGIILLMGIVKKNGIMMVDFALEGERQRGKSATDAIYEASLLRFRPIMMTTMAALLGGLPLALGTGFGSELRRPLGIAMVGGLLVSQALTLYTTPVIISSSITSGNDSPAAGRNHRNKRPPRRSLHEPLRSVHPKAGGNDPADCGSSFGWSHWLHRASRVSLTAGGLPHYFSFRQPSRRERPNHGVFRRQPAGTPVRAHRGRERDDIVEHARQYFHHHTIRP